jgi:hypothetical protein
MLLKVLAVLALSALPVSASAQGVSTAPYDLVSIPGVPGSPLGIAFRSVDPAKHGGATHEFLLAHPVWGHGYSRIYKKLDCGRASYARIKTEFVTWAGSSPATHRDEPAPEVTLAALFSPSMSDGLLFSIGCTPAGFKPKRVDGPVVPALRAMAGAFPRMFTVTSGGLGDNRQASVAYPGKWGHYSFPLAMMGADYRQTGGKMEDGDLELLYYAEVYQNPPKNAVDVYNDFYKDAQEAGPIKFIRTADDRSYGFISVSSERPNRIARVLVCRNDAFASFVATATYRTSREEIRAWRFVNSLKVDCPGK